MRALGRGAGEDVEPLFTFLAFFCFFWCFVGFGFFRLLDFTSASGSFHCRRSARPGAIRVWRDKQFCPRPVKAFLSVLFGHFCPSRQGVSEDFSAAF
jgi:hypothetical protein